MAKSGSFGHDIPVAFVICEKLRPHWANLMGSIGYRTLLSRALAIALPNVGWLNTVVVKPDGSLEWASESDARVDAKDIAIGSTVLVAELLGLLEGFIGETMALRLMQDVWPKLPLSDSGSDKGKLNEKAKRLGETQTARENGAPAGKGRDPENPQRRARAR